MDNSREIEIRRIDCGKDVVVSCNPDDCRLIDITQKGVTTSFFAATLSVCSSEKPNCETKPDSRRQNEPKYVTLSGLKANCDDQNHGKVTIESTDPDKLQAEIIAVICGCINGVIEDEIHPFTVRLIDAGSDTVNWDEEHHVENGDSYNVGDYPESEVVVFNISTFLLNDNPPTSGLWITLLATATGDGAAGGFPNFPADSNINEVVSEYTLDTGTVGEKSVDVAIYTTAEPDTKYSFTLTYTVS